MGSVKYSTTHIFLKGYSALNVYDENNLRTGYWEFKLPITDKIYAKGFYFKGNKIGFWMFYGRKELYTVKNRKIKIDRLCKLNIKICQKCTYGEELSNELNQAFYDENNLNHCLKWIDKKTYNEDECCVPLECPYYLEQIALKGDDL